MEQDKVLDQLDERAQELRRSEFLGPDYVPDANAVFEEDQLHAEIVYLDDVTNPEVVVEASQAESFEEVEDAIEDLTDVVEQGLDSLSSTLLQQKEDAAVEAASTIKHYPVALYGQPNFGDRIIDVESDNSDIVDGQQTQTTELVAIRDIMEDVLVEQREQSRYQDAEDAEFNEIEDDMFKREQIMLLENMNETLEDIERNAGGQGGGLFDSLLDMVGLGGGKDGKKGGKHKDNGINRRGNKSGFLKGRAGSIIQGAIAAGAGLYIFDDFLWGDETDPTDKGFVGAIGDTLFGSDPTPEQQQIMETTKESYANHITTNNTQTQIVQDSEGDSSPFTQGAMALGGTLAIGAGYKKFVGEPNLMMGTKGGLNAALHAPALPAPTSNPVQSLMAKGGAVAGEAAGSSKSLLSRIPYLNLLLGGLDAYNVVTNDELSTSEKVADVAGIGGGFAGAAAGASAMGALGTAVGTVVPGLGNLIGGGLGTLIGGGLGYWGGEELVSSTMDWLLGNDEEQKPETVTTAEQAAKTAPPQEEWWETEPTQTSDGKIIAGNRTFPNMEVYRKMQDHKINFETAKADGKVQETKVTRVNGEVVTDIDEAQVETTQLSAEATAENSSALDKLTKAIDDAGLGLTGLGAIAGSAKTAWDWAKGVFGFNDEEPKEVTAEQAVTAPSNIESVYAAHFGDAAVDQLDAATQQPKKGYLKEWKTSSSLYNNAQSNTKVEKVTHTNATLKEAVSAINTYSETQRGYDNWIDDFGKTDVTYDQFLSYFNGTSAQPQFVGSEIVSSKTESNSNSETTEVSNDKQVNEVTHEEKVVDPMNGVTPQATPSKQKEVNWTPTQSPWHNWSDTNSDYSKFSEQGDGTNITNTNTNTVTTPYRIEQNPNANIEVAPASTDVRHSNFVETRHTILDTAADVRNSAQVEQAESKSSSSQRATTRDSIKTRPANRAAGKSARPTISSVPIIIDDSGLTALNLGYL